MRVFRADSGKPDPNVFGLGDAATNEDAPLPALAQVAEQQGKYLANVLNASAKQSDGTDPDARASPGSVPAFQYHHLGSMASLTTGSAVIELGSSKQFTMTGLMSWLAWRSAYLTRLGTVKRKVHVAAEWLPSYFSGRDMSQQ